MLRPRAPQQLGYSLDEFASDVWGGTKKIVTTPFKLAKDVITLDPCGLIRDTISIGKARDLVAKIGCNPAGAAAAQAGIMSLSANPALATIGAGVIQTCLCNMVQQTSANQFPPGFFQQQPLPQQYVAAQQPIYKKPIFWIGVTAAIAGIVLATSNKSKSSSSAAPASAPVVVNVKTSKDEEE